MSRTPFATLSTLAAFALASAACGGPEVRHPYAADDSTPVNSVSESRLKGEDPTQPKATPKGTAAANEASTEPAVQKVSDMPKPGERSDAPKNPGDKPQGRPSKAGPKVSRAECDRAFDKAVELEIKGRPELQGIDQAQLIASAKSMARQQHGDAPCDATRAQYDCAMAATSTAEWKRCMQ